MSKFITYLLIIIATFIIVYLQVPEVQTFFDSLFSPLSFSIQDVIQ